MGGGGGVLLHVFRMMMLCRFLDNDVGLETGDEVYYVLNFQLKKIAESGQKMPGAVFDPTWHSVLSEVSVSASDQSRVGVAS